MLATRKITLLIESRANDWDSVRELQPAIVGQWTSFCQDHDIEFQVLRAENERALSIVNKSADSDWVVVASHSERIFSALKILRKFSERQPRFAIYLFGLSTVGCWPLQLDGTLKALNNADLFLGTCDGDSKCMKLSFENARVAITSFPLSPLPIQMNDPENQIRLTYIGRVSRQKNIHTIIEALDLLSDSDPDLDWHFDVFGKEDKLGIPVLGIEDENYLQELIEKTKGLSLEKRVHFHGWRTAQDIWSQLHPKNTVIVSASLHSEENFGIAAFRGLSLGFRAVLSHWGGHQNLADLFSKAVNIVPVHFGSEGPRIYPRQVSEALARALKDAPPAVPPQQTSLNDIARFLDEGNPGLKVQSTSFGQKLVEQRLQFMGKNTHQVFLGPTDPAFQTISEAYGAIKEAF